MLQFNSPVDLTGYTARLTLRANLSDVEAIDEFTTEDVRLPGTGIVIDETDSVISLFIGAAVTEAYDFTSAVYDLEMVSASGRVTRIW